MNRDGEIVIMGGVPIGLAVVGVGLATGIEELTLTGVGLAASACVLGFGFDLLARGDDAELAP